jgi:hypothetical protein
MGRVEELFKEGLEKKVIKQSEFESTYRDRMDKGFYVEEVKKTQQALKDASHQMDKMYDNSLFERITGGSLVGTGLALHSFFWLLTNLLAAQGNFMSLLHNPYVWAAIGEAALAAEIIPGSLKIGSGNLGIGSGWVTRLYEKISEKEGKLSTAKENSYKVIGEIYLNFRDFGGYLENGGAGTIHNLRAAKSAGGEGGEKLLISIDELLAEEKDPMQQERLKHAVEKFPKQTYQQINAVAEALTVLEIDNQTTFNAKLQYIKDEQGLKNSPTPTITPGTQPQEPLKDVPS